MSNLNKYDREWHYWVATAIVTESQLDESEMLVSYNTSYRVDDMHKVTSHLFSTQVANKY